jgi:hypothetical protein
VTAFARSVALVVLLSANGRAAEHDWPAPLRAKAPEERLSLSVSNRAGIAEAPFVTSAFPRVSGFGMVLTGAGAVRLSSTGWLRVRLPVSFAWLDYPAGAQVPEAALGNLELGLHHPFDVSPATRVGFLAAVLAPSAEHGSKTALLDNRALAVGSALSGGQDSPLLTPGVTGLRLRASVEHSQRPFELRASLDLPLLMRISDASLPEETETHSIGVLPAIELEAAWRISSWFDASLGGALVTEALRVQEPALEGDRNRRLQPVVQPGLHFQLGQHVTLGLDGSVPVGGSLGGEAWSVRVGGRLGL